MKIDDATRVETQERSRDNLSEVCEEGPLCADRLDACDLSCVAHLGNMFNAQSCASRPGIDRGWREGTASTRGAWWRGHDGEDAESRVCSNGAERRDRESTTAK